MIDKLAASKILPILTFDDADHALPTGEALLTGGMTCAEVTFRTPAAAPAIRRIAARFPDLALGAGTIITVAQAEEALAAGATYLIAPGFSAEVATYCRQHAVPYFPGVMTPTDIMQAMAHGLTTLKLFPAEAAGGVRFLKALAGPFFNVRFIPTGGVSQQNLADYLRLPNVTACGGSWIASRALIRSQNVAQIADNAAQALSTARQGISVKR